MSVPHHTSASPLPSSPEDCLGRILIVEDEGIVAHDLADTLQAMRYRVLAIAETGEEAIAAARTLVPDLVLMDIRLGGSMDGIEAAARIRSERDVPIVYLTAHADDETTRRAKQTQPFGYLIKPFRAPDLRCAIEIASHKHASEARADRQLDDEIERRVAERTAQLQVANQELESFSYSVAHDLRTPLRGINGFSQALLEDHGERLGPAGVEYIRRMRAATGRMAELIDDLLCLARVARAEFERGSVNLSRLAESVSVDLRAAHPGRTVTFSIADGISVNGDERLLRIALENLLANAWKFTSRRSDARIELGRVSDGAESIYFVRDNGAGFDMQYADKLFRPFQRLHAPCEFEGSGVGLAIVHRIIHQHGGRIWAESSIGQGATFYFAI